MSPHETAKALQVQKRQQSEEAFGVYIHWPFCQQKCPYCDFNSHVRFEGWDEERFLSAYTRELTWCHGLSPGQTVTSVFFGGGTPSLMQPKTVAAILDHIARLWPVSDGVEITLEANPGSVEASRFTGYRAAGVNRVSIGVQSLIDSELKALGRIHSSDEARRAIKIAEQTFTRFSFDLIYARPNQAPDGWRKELSDALTMAGGHISLYQLTIEDGTPFAELHAKGKLQVPPGEAAHDLFEITQELTELAGLRAYEISNHARPGEESRHNLIYWRYCPYAGVGPGAHGRLATGETRLATETLRAPEAWCDAVLEKGNGLLAQSELSNREMADEALLMGLRLREGLDLTRFAALSGFEIDREEIEALTDLGMLEWCSDPAAPFHQRTGPDPFDPPIMACIGPGLAPAVNRLPPVMPGPAQAGVARIRATPRGRFVLNRVVYQLSSALKPLSG